MIMFEAIKDHVQRLGEWLSEGADEKTRAFDALSAQVSSLTMIVTSLNARIAMLEHGGVGRFTDGPICAEDLKFGASDVTTSGEITNLQTCSAGKAPASAVTAMGA